MGLIITDITLKTTIRCNCRLYQASSNDFMETILIRIVVSPFKFVLRDVENKFQANKFKITVPFYIHKLLCGLVLELLLF